MNSIQQGLPISILTICMLQSLFSAGSLICSHQPRIAVWMVVWSHNRKHFNIKPAWFLPSSQPIVWLELNLWLQCVTLELAWLLCWFSTGKILKINFVHSPLVGHVSGMSVASRGVVSIDEYHLTSIGIPIIKIRQSHNCLIIIMQIPIPGRGKIIIPMYRSWLNGLYGLYGPRCPLFSKRPINLISLSLSLPYLETWYLYWNGTQKCECNYCCGTGSLSPPHSSARHCWQTGQDRWISARLQ